LRCIFFFLLFNSLNGLNMTYITIFIIVFFSHDTSITLYEKTRHNFNLHQQYTQQWLSGEKGYTSPEIIIKSEPGTQKKIRHRFDPEPFALLAVWLNSVNLAELDDGSGNPVGYRT
jgi:hypothetical protein